MLSEFHKKDTTKSLVACKVQLKNKKRVYLFKHPLPVVALVIKVYTLENGLSQVILLE